MIILKYSFKNVQRIFFLPILLCTLVIFVTIFSLMNISEIELGRLIAVILIAILFLTVILIPNLFLYNNYSKVSKDTIVIYENYIKISNSVNSISYDLKFIKKIEYVECWNYNYPSLDKYNYIRIHFIDNFKIIITSLMYNGDLFEILQCFNKPVKCINKTICTIDENFDEKAKNNVLRSSMI